MATISVADMKEMALPLLAEATEGAPLSALTAALIALGVAVSVTSLDRAAIEQALSRAFDAGATPPQAQEVIALVSGLGMHSLMASANTLWKMSTARGLLDSGMPLDANQQRLWDTYVSNDSYWRRFERGMPGFLQALLRLSPETFAAFFAYSAVPWESGTVAPLTKELIALATNATPTHRFVPGFCLHLRNALKLGGGKAAILQTLAIAAAAPEHNGTI